MRTTIDAAGRIVVPKALRDQIGLIPGQVDIAVVGSRIVIEPTSDESLVEEDGLLVIPASGELVTDDDVRGLLESGRR
ncbi:MAG: AbrB/MazE/SpoVT family DNA-binding domain-containing protein [Actinomycetota bacterium]|jgi:AbrB family looped-hinge helix DNA binding protein|nr:AbrB/MazE/SpoVT family DNA-binding domain-containing protein [Actinomycetota bacterium]